MAFPQNKPGLDSLRSNFQKQVRAINTHLQDPVFNVNSQASKEFAEDLRELKEDVAILSASVLLS